MREQKEQEKQNELLRVVAEQNHERLIEYDVKEDRAVVYACLLYTSPSPRD